MAYQTYSVAREKTSKATEQPDSPEENEQSEDNMDNFKRTLGDAGAFLKSTVQVLPFITPTVRHFLNWFFFLHFYFPPVQDAHITDDAGTMFNRAKQFTEERLGKAERTENDEAFENMATRSDKIKGYTEKLVKNTEAVLVPNPAARLETMMFDNAPMDKIGVTNTRLTNLEYLGADMIEAGNEFSSGTPYGSALIRVGQTEQGKNNSSNNSALHDAKAQTYSFLHQFCSTRGNRERIHQKQVCASIYSTINYFLICKT